MLSFGLQKQKHELSDLYEVKIKNMGNAGRNGGEYYTPRPLIRAMIEIVAPELGESIYDGACGSAGFLCEAFEHLSSKKELTTSNLKTLQEKTFYGREKKPLPYVIAIMNMILHGIDAPNIERSNTLGQNIDEIREKDRYDIVLANPPFGGKERSEVKQNFPIQSSETAYLFLQHFIKILKVKGRAGIVIKNTFLLNRDAASVQLRQHLFESCNVHTVLILPSGTFQGAGVRTVVLFFDKGTPTKKVWFYQLRPGRTLGKTNPLNDEDLMDFKKLQKRRATTSNSWNIDISEIRNRNWSLSLNHPQESDDAVASDAVEVVESLQELNVDGSAILESLEKKIRAAAVLMREIRGRQGDIDSVGLVHLAHIEYGERVVRKKDGGTKFPVYGGGGATFNIDRFNRSDCFIVSRFGMSAECVRKVDGKFFLNDSGLSVRTRNEDVLLQDFLDRFLLANQPLIYSMGRGAAQKNLDMDAFKEIPIPLMSIADQRLIIDSYDEIEAISESLLENAEQRFLQVVDLRQSSLENSFGGQL